MPEGEPKSPWLDAGEIKRQVTIERVLDRYGLLGKLQGAGPKRRGLSPFRNENKPSFSVDLGRNVWNDFPRPTVDGNEVPGNVIGLVMAFENCTFRDALVKLQEDFLGGPPAPEHVASERRRRVTEALNPAAPEFPSANEPFGKELKGLRFDVPYLAEKGLGPDRAKYWGVGYCSRGMMKGRIVVPIRSRDGSVMAYAGRSLDDENIQGKWRFPNGFAKSLELFNMDKIANDKEAREASAKHGLIVVEGFMDAIMLSERGYKNVVSVMGTEVSDAQHRLLVDAALNPSRKLALFFDFDRPGRERRKKACSQLIRDAFVRYVDPNRLQHLGERTDPDEFTETELHTMLAARTVVHTVNG